MYSRFPAPRHVILPLRCLSCSDSGGGRDLPPPFPPRCSILQLSLHDSRSSQMRCFLAMRTGPCPLSVLGVVIGILWLGHSPSLIPITWRVRRRMFRNWSKPPESPLRRLHRIGLSGWCTRPSGCMWKVLPVLVVTSLEEDWLWLPPLCSPLSV